MSINTDLKFFYNMLLNLGDNHINTDIKDILGSMGYTGSLNSRLGSASDTDFAFLTFSDGSFIQVADGSYIYN